ncbi:hypothetical protein [Bacillus cereus group sp. MG6]|uniref:hypothetical protein n=1 Tax=Bacillus cereus group sp. MG6 TaxID=3040246 RepID=UPI003398BAB1
MEYISYNKQNIMQLRYQANEIWKEVKKEKRVFEKPLKGINGSTAEVRIRGEKELQHWIEKSGDYAKELCSKLCPSCIPVLVQMCELFYYGSWKCEPLWLGTTIKRVIAMLYKNQFKNVGEKLSKSKLDIINALYAAILEETLVHVELVSNFTELDLTLNREWLKANDENTDYYWRQAALMYSNRGKSHRTLKDSISTWVYQPHDLLQSIENVLKGNAPSEQRLFKNNMFGFLPTPYSQGKKAFWEKLRSLVQLAIAVAQQLESNNLPKDSIVFLPGNKLLNQQEFNGEHFQIRSDIYWKESWFNDITKKVSKTNFQNILIYRPIIGYSENTDLNVTSLGIIGDAINNFVESSIFDYAGHETPFDKSYEDIIATPFELEVKNILLEKGFITGVVNKEKGGEPAKIFWDTMFDGKQEKIELTNKNGEVFPGQIDVLAYHSELKLLVLLECKTFRIPYTATEMKRLKERFTKTTKGSFQKKLQMKLEWLKNSICSPNIKDIPINLFETEIQSFFVVDRYIVNFNEEPRTMVIDVECLKEILSDIEVPQTV